MNTTAAGTIDTAPEASESEMARYERAFRETRRVLDESIESLMILEEFEDDSTMRDQLALKRLELETDRTDLVRSNIAFHTGTATMHPPSPALVAEIVELSKKAAELTVQKSKATGFLKLATSALTKFAQIADIKAG